MNYVMTTDTELSRYRNEKGPWIGTLYKGHTEKPDGIKIGDLGPVAYKSQGTHSKTTAEQVDKAFAKQYSATGVRFVRKNTRIVPVVDVVVRDFNGNKINDIVYDNTDSIDIPSDVTLMFGIELDVQNPFIMPNETWSYEIYMSGGDYRARAKRISQTNMIINKALPTKLHTRNVPGFEHCKGACGKQGYNLFAEEIEQLSMLRGDMISIAHPDQDTMRTNQSYSSLVLSKDGSIHLFTGSGSHVNMKEDKVILNAESFENNAEEKKERGLLASGSARNNMETIKPQSNLFFPYPAQLPPIQNIINVAGVIVQLKKVIGKVKRFMDSI